MQKVKHDISRGSLRFSETQWKQLIGRLESGKGPTVPATRDRRDLDNHRYPHCHQAAIRVVHPGGNATSHLVRTRNLSVGGVGLIHSSFLYPRTSCHLALRTVWGESVALPGKILWCRHVTGRCHEIGVRFDQLIQIDEFVPEDIRANQSWCTD